MKLVRVLLLAACLCGALDARAQVRAAARTASPPTLTPGPCAVVVANDVPVVLAGDRTSGLFVLSPDAGIAGPQFAGATLGVAARAFEPSSGLPSVLGFTSVPSTGIVESFTLEAGAVVPIIGFQATFPSALALQRTAAGARLFVGGPTLQLFDVVGADGGLMTIAQPSRPTANPSALFVHDATGTCFALVARNLLVLPPDGGASVPVYTGTNDLTGLAGMGTSDGGVVLFVSEGGSSAIIPLVGSPDSLSALPGFSVDSPQPDGGAQRVTQVADLAVTATPSTGFGRGVLALRDVLGSHYKLVSLSDVAQELAAPVLADGVPDRLPADAGSTDGGAGDGGQADGGSADGGLADGGGFDGGSGDAGAVDGGLSDAGAADGGARDAGGPVGTGSRPGGSSGGVGEPDMGFNRCGCASGGLVPLLALVALWRRRKEQR